MAEEDIENMHLSKETSEPQHDKSKSNPADMTEQEMSQHLSLCLKLAAENKINTKNAFGLHLIDIMRRMVKQNASDLQAASMSLQASSKIYAGRVEALYKDTFAFHNHLQTIVANKKVREEKENGDMEDDEDNEGPRERRKTSKPRQTYIGTEENVAFKSEIAQTHSAPHANFITIKSAFTASRTDPKLLEGLVVQNDSNEISCTKSAPCFYLQKPAPLCDILFSDKCRALIAKSHSLKLNHTEFSSALTSSDVFYNASKQASPPPPPQPDFEVNSDDSFCIGAGSPILQEPEQDGDMREIIQRFSVLDITADLFTNEVSLAIVNDNTVDRHLLPPGSALKRILNTADKRGKKTPQVEKVRREKPPREPFFNKQRVIDKSILTKGRKIELTDNEIAKWRIEDTVDKRFGCHELFSAILSENFDETNTDKNEKISSTLYKILQEKTEDSLLSGFFCKKLQAWNHFKRQNNANLIRPSSFGGFLRNEEQSKELSASSETNSNGIVQSFENLSLRNSMGSFEDDDGCPPDNGDVPDAFSPERPAHKSRLSGFFEDDLKSVMVTPPELVKPINMKIHTEPITLSTDKVKHEIWKCVENIESIPLSDVHEKLKIVFNKEKLPLQYAFAMLLLLANEKCLLLKTTPDGTDIEIKKDTPELEGICT